MRQRLAKWMMGRNGMDALNRLLSVLTLIVLIVSMFVHGYAARILPPVSTVCIETAQRMPISSAARATIGACQYMSFAKTVPERMRSRIARRALA